MSKEEDQRQVISVSKNLDVRSIPNFVDLLRDEVKKSYLASIAQPNMMACSVCGPIPYLGPNHCDGHFCDDPEHRPHEQLFVVNALFPIVFGKLYTPAQDGSVPTHYIEAMAELFNQIAVVFRVHGVLVPACRMHLTRDDNTQSHMLGLYFFANTTSQYLNAMYDTDAFCEDDKTGNATPDWGPLIGRINFIKNNIGIYNNVEQLKAKPKKEEQTVSMGKLIPFHLPGRGQA